MHNHLITNDCDLITLGWSECMPNDSTLDSAADLQRTHVSFYHYVDQNISVLLLSLTNFKIQLKSKTSINENVM